MVRRYIEGGYGVSEMEEDAQGDWVRYEDYAKLLNVVYLLTDCVNTDAIPDSLYEKLEEMGLL